MSPDVVIIGAGVSGLSAAHALASAGLAVTLLDKGPAARESTWAGAGILSLLLPWHYPEAVQCLAEQGRRRWPVWIERLRAQTGLDAEYRVSGMLVLDDDAWPAARGWGQRAGRPVEPATPDRLSACPGASGGIWLPDVAQVRNPRLGRMLESAARQMGVELLPHTPVTGLITEPGRVRAVLTEAGPIACGQVVVCAGAWSQRLLGARALGARIRPVRGQILLLRGPAEGLPSIVYRAGRYLVPRADGLVLVGSTLEEAGYDKTPTRAARDALLGFALETCPALRGCRVERHWAGLRPGSPGNLPCIGRHPELTNLFMNSGHFRYGLTMAPAAAELLAALMLGGNSALDPAPYAWPVAPTELDEV